MRINRQQKIIIRLIIGAFVIFIAVFTGFVADRYRTNRSAYFRIEGNRVQIFLNRKWQDFSVNGITMAQNFSKQEYTRYFKSLSEMDVNVVRISAILPPDFYKAFFEYNILTSKPIYLLQGIPVNKDGSQTGRNAYEDRFNTGFLEEIRRTIDVVNGKAGSKHSDDHTSDTYSLNNAPYVMGYVLGEAVNSDFIATTNAKNLHVMGFEGDYLYTAGATPYEAWLAAVGNFAISYEQEKYGGPCRLVSWPNWPESGRPGGGNPEHILSTEKFSAGILASYLIQDKFTGHLN